jgi:tetratricopeptide (TPR) repeat protein
MRFARTIAVVVLSGALALSLWSADKPSKDAKSQETMVTLIQKGEYQKAIDLGEQFVAAKKADQSVYMNLGVSYEKLKNYPKSIESYEEALKLSPLDTAPLLGEASCYQEQNDMLKLAETLKRIVDIDPTKEDVRYSLAGIYDKQGKPDDAMAQYEAIYQTNPGFKDVAYAIGLGYYSKDQFDKAMPYFDKAAQLTPGDEQVLLAQGQNFLKAKDYEKAVTPLKAFLDITKNENYKPAMTGTVAGLYMKMAESAMASVKDSKDKAAVAKAEAVAKENYTNAVVYFDKLLVLRPNSEIALEGKGRALDKTGKPQEAIATFKQYLALSKNEAEKKVVAQRVKELESGKK